MVSISYPGNWRSQEAKSNDEFGMMNTHRGGFAMVRQILTLTTLLLSCLSSAVLTTAQSKNLLQNPNAELGTQYWRPMRQAVEMTTGGNTCFVVRNKGYFYQDVSLPADAIGQYAVLIGRGSSERINDDGAITGLPYLYGYMMDQVTPKGGHILEYLQGQQMLSSAKSKDEWVDMWGIFRVPEGTKTIRFFLNQAERRGVPQNNSAARFDNVGLYLFSTKEDAQAFVNGYH
jgi:hypothetical protein